MAHEISFSIILRLSDDPVKACEEHEKFASALRVFVAAVGLETHRPTSPCGRSARHASAPPVSRA